MYYTKTHLEDFTENLYKSIDVFYPHQLDADLIAARLGIALEYIDGYSKCVESENSFSLIMLNNSLPYPLQWQEFAHELSHLLRHSGNQHLLPPGFKQMQEWQADHFSFYFCVPSFMLDQISVPASKKEAVMLVAEQFNVTPVFAAARLRQWASHLMF